MYQDNISFVMRKSVYAICEQKRHRSASLYAFHSQSNSPLLHVYTSYTPLDCKNASIFSTVWVKKKNMCVYYCMEKLNRVGRLENVFILLKKNYMGIKEWKKKTLGSEAKSRDGRMIVNKHTFLWPYTFWFASFISFGLVRPRKNIVVTCVSDSLPKTIRIGRSTQLFYFIFWVCAKNLRSVGEPDTHFFLGLIFRNADFLFIMLGQL